ncbi:hypothetical protein P154DRAFT_580822 [Amniculicola lignicola CBS 123094]|uniref:Uncharacterized protein n=1 Tax=Amniculicola lignicola CBS 123094 TaxID=1392246 RepID=A0A6A5W8R7_9PLEO|nr:hypothetical protein P154DRAFT_580822 [Amniculicola lignicola CBS 123094]
MASFMALPQEGRGLLCLSAQLRLPQHSLLHDHTTLAVHRSSPIDTRYCIPSFSAFPQLDSGRATLSRETSARLQRLCADLGALFSCDNIARPPAHNFEQEGN